MCEGWWGKWGREGRGIKIFFVTYLSGGGEKISGETVWAEGS